jgi:GTP-binding protein
MFVDEVRVYLKAGDGGSGALSFRREKYVPHGGPDGGDGGRGGDVILRVAAGETTLSAYRGRHHYRAGSGGGGAGANRHGKDGDDLVLEVPPGTVVRRDDGSVVRDLRVAGETVIAARGGRGGRGNARFATARDRAPRLAERGEPGEEGWFILELRLVADIGLLGLPNAGKSTLLSRLTNARPKVGDYPFTTIQPELGILERDGKGLVLADLPGLIEGAHAGRGLGDLFLRHASRCRAFLHVLDASDEEAYAGFLAVREEVRLYDPEIAERPYVVALNKLDLPTAREAENALRSNLESLGSQVYAISAASGQGLAELADAIWRLAALAPQQEPLPAETKERQDPTAFRVVPEGDGFRVEGVTVERRVAMTDLDSERAVRSLQRYLRRKGVEAALKRAGATTGQSVRIRDHEFEFIEGDDA